MMDVLAIECSTGTGSVAWLRGGEVVRVWGFESPRGRGSLLFSTLEEATGAFGSPDRVVVGTGPGSYNGLRSSIAVGWGISRSTGAEFLGAPSLLGYEAVEYCVVGDARAGQVFFARVSQGRFTSGPALYPADAARRLLTEGETVFCAAELEAFPEAVVAAPRAEVLAVREATPGFPSPIYLKPPHITAPRSAA